MSLEPLLPIGSNPGRPPKWTKRQLINGIRWRIRIGAPWQDIPRVYGPCARQRGIRRSNRPAGPTPNLLITGSAAPGLQLPSQPWLPGASWDQGHDPGAG
ncbi:MULTISPECIES: transposase [Amycolatopsis]|uniref:Transposase n=1 Tax=Amycolatopsis thermalba TaxID=944492 RepID=A0ABY4NQK1_9PSEU|nr:MULTISPECIES: transposase [Amycolatopsis]UQS22505.1 transposase [Amycolatopsis thermalba]